MAFAQVLDGLIKPRGFHASIFQNARRIGPLGGCQSGKRALNRNKTIASLFGRRFRRVCNLDKFGGQIDLSSTVTFNAWQFGRRGFSRDIGLLDVAARGRDQR